MKMWDIIREDFESSNNLNEGWKDNIMATIFGIASIFGGLKAQNKTLPADSVNVSQQMKNDSIKLDIGRFFESGKYSFTKADSKSLGEELRKLGNEILKNPNSEFIVEIVSSESRVPNYDKEPSSPTYNQELPEGELATRRAQTVQFVLETFVKELKENGVLKGEVKFVTPPTIRIGKATWPSINPETMKRRVWSDPMYKADQYVYANIKINPNKVDPFSAFAEMGEPIYRHDNKQLFGILFYDTKKTDKISVSGNLNTAYQNVLLKTVKPNTAISGKKNDPNVYLKSYIIPFEWWNSNVHYGLTEANIDYITSHFEVK